MPSNPLISSRPVSNTLTTTEGGDVTYPDGSLPSAGMMKVAIDGTDNRESQLMLAHRENWDIDDRIDCRLLM